MTEQKRTSGDASFGRVLLLLAVFALFWQGRSLYIYPIHDSANYWYGDESWVMFEARTQMSEGIVRHPYAYGATLNDQLGVLLGNSWGSSLLYGLPALVFAESFPAIAVGRTVTFLLTLLAVLFIYFVTRKLGASAVGSGFASILLATAPAITLASHSARSDILVALLVMFAVAYFANEVSRSHERSSKWWFGFGSAMTLTAFLFAIHLITLLLPLAIYLLFRLGAFRKINRTAYAMLGVLVVVTLLVGTYYLFTHDLSLFGTSGQHVQFVDVTAQKPIMRMLSRSVQWNNLVQRVVLLWDGAPAFLILLAVAVFTGLAEAIRKRHRYAKEGRIRALIVLSSIVAGSWLLLQGSISYYLPHFLLVATLVMIVVVDRAFFKSAPTMFVQWVVGIAALILIVMHISETDLTLAASRLFSNENHRAILKLQTRLHEDAGMSHPVVLAESPAAYGLELDSSITLMSPLFPAFPKLEEPIATTLARYHVHYAMLYDSKVLRDSATGAPQLTRYIESHAVLVDSAIGILFDMKRSYVNPDLTMADTMKLYRLDDPR